MRHSKQDRNRVVQALGKELPKGSVVHHHTQTQLVLCQDQKYYKVLHQRQKALKACGHAHWIICHYCKNYDDPWNLKYRRQARQYFHQDCVNKYLVEYAKQHPEYREKAKERSKKWRSAAESKEIQREYKRQYRYEIKLMRQQNVSKI